MRVSIPSNGSIQFLQYIVPEDEQDVVNRLNPLKRVNSILTLLDIYIYIYIFSIVSIPSNGSIQFLPDVLLKLLKIGDLSLNPLKRVNSILTVSFTELTICALGLNPLKRVNSILTVSFTELTICALGLNPLKRVNSILTG